MVYYSNYLYRQEYEYSIIAHFCNHALFSSTKAIAVGTVMICD